MLKSNWGSTYEDRPTPQGDRVVNIANPGWADLFDLGINLGISAERVRERINELRAQQTDMERLRQMEGTFEMLSGPEDEPDPGPLDWDWEYRAPRESKTDDACYTEYDWEVAQEEDNNDG